MAKGTEITLIVVAAAAALLVLVVVLAKPAPAPSGDLSWSDALKIGAGIGFL